MDCERGRGRGLGGAGGGALILASGTSSSLSLALSSAKRMPCACAALNAALSVRERLSAVLLSNGSYSARALPLSWRGGAGDGLAESRAGRRLEDAVGGGEVGSGGDDDDDDGEEGRLAACSQPWKMKNIPFLGNITFLQETSVSVPVPVPVCLCTNIFV